MKRNLLESLAVVSEKAASIARLCRRDEHLFELLVQEKSSAESNPRFVRDFKTLADVLIQETVKRDVGRLFPELKDRIFGEENNVFENRIGERITVEVKDNEEETSELLASVLNGDLRAAKVLARNVHSDLKISEVDTDRNLPLCEDCEDFCIWIDPIDSTAEYINATDKKTEDDISISGLTCVTVLLGVFDKTTGNPVIGIVNQPFYEQIQHNWKGRCLWSYANNSSVKHIPVTTRKICVSSSESKEVKLKLEKANFQLLEAAGAGYKILLVILGIVDVYLLSKDSTFKWDTCGPQSILNSINGGLIIYKDAVDGNIVNVQYKFNPTESGSKIESSCNVGGIIAYNNKDMLYEVLNVLRN